MLIVLICEFTIREWIITSTKEKKFICILLYMPGNSIIFTLHRHCRGLEEIQLKMHYSYHMWEFLGLGQFAADHQCNGGQFTFEYLLDNGRLIENHLHGYPFLEYISILDTHYIDEKANNNIRMK